MSRIVSSNTTRRFTPPDTGANFRRTELDPNRGGRARLAREACVSIGVVEAYVRGDMPVRPIDRQKINAARQRLGC